MFTALPLAAPDTNNLMVGKGSALASSSDTNETVIGSGATGNGSNTVTLGKFGTSDAYLPSTIHTLTIEGLPHFSSFQLGV